MNELQEKEIAIKYFLGGLSANEQESLEERFFTDEKYGDFLDEIEADLIDEYVRGEFSDDQKQKFEKNYLVSDKRQNRVKAAVALWERERISAQKVKTVEVASSVTFWQKISELFRSPNFAYALSAIVVLLIGGVIFFNWQDQGKDIVVVTPTPTPLITPTPFIPTPTPANTNTSENQNVNKSPENQSSNTEKTIESNKPKTEPENRKVEAPRPMIATFILSGGGLRGNDETQKLAVSAQTKTVLLKIEDEQISKYNRFQLQLEDENGAIIATRNLATKKTLKTLNFGVEGKTLQNKNYRLIVKGAKDDGGFEPINFYKFSVQKK